MLYQKSLNEIVDSVITNIHDALPQADTKEGTFVRDVFIDPVSDEMAGMYGSMKLMEMAQSILTANGIDLERLAANYFVTRKQAEYSTGKIRFYVALTNKTNLNSLELPSEISIPIGTSVATTSTLVTDPVEFKTTESIYLTRTTIYTLPIDSSNGYRFYEVAIKAAIAGTKGNVASSTINQLISNISDGIAFINNPYSTSGGTNYESDVSLAFRINLAITGANIGTKAGYLSYILRQSNVLDATIIGAGDNIMFRDDGYISSNGDYVAGKGGKVDIYIRGVQNSESIYTFPLTTEYVKTYKDIILPYQPVNDIISVSAVNAGVNYINSANFGIERSVDSTTKEVNNAYYQDLLWDFSIIDTFPDTTYYPLPTNLTDAQITLLKQQVDAELNNAINYLSNFNYSINWDLIYYKTDSSGYTDLFKKVFYQNDNKVYKIIAYDERLNGRVFIKKDDNIYVRIYSQPDFSLNKDRSVIGGSNRSKDSLTWLKGGAKPAVGDSLQITYNYDQLVRDIQTGIDYNRCLTADVLVKQSDALEIEVILEALCYADASPDTTKKLLNNRISTYIDNVKRMGGDIDRSDIAAIARQTEGVDSIDLDSVQIGVVGGAYQRKISARLNQYFETKNIVITVYSNDRVII